MLFTGFLDIRKTKRVNKAQAMMDSIRNVIVLHLKSRTLWRILRRLKDLYKVSGMPVIPTLIPTSKVVRKPGLVVRKIEKVGRNAYLCCVKRV